MNKRILLIVILAAFSVIAAGIILLVFLLNDSVGGLTTVGNYQDIGNYLNKDASWYGSDEGIDVADAIVDYQLPDGGWRKAWDDPTVTGSWAKSTIDNDGTTSEIYILAKAYNATSDKKYKKACLKGIDLLLDAQYDNGGWPQVFDDPGTYHAHITYNDYAMVHVLNLLSSVADKSGDFTFVDSKRAEKAAAAVKKGVQCILDTQIEVRGVKTAWCQQYDEVTLQPATGRAYELPSICSAESVGIVDFLKSLPERSPEITESVNAAISWMENSKLTGIKFVSQGDDKVVVEDESADPIWARFYEIETNRPIFVDRDGILRYDVSEIGKERRTGYAWYGTWPKKIVAAGPIE